MTTGINLHVHLYAVTYDEFLAQWLSVPDPQTSKDVLTEHCSLFSTRRPFFGQK